MIKLMKLELQRNNLLTYVAASLLIFAFGFGFCFLIASIPSVEQMRTGVPLPADMLRMMECDNFISLISVMFSVAFSVLSAVMHAKIIVEEYAGKRAILLFSYPIKRSRILFAKCSLVFFFTVIAAFTCSVAAISIFALCSNAFHILPNLFTGEMLPKLFMTAGVLALLAGAVGLVAMRIGFWRKSLAAAVTSSFLLAAPFGNTVSFFPDHSLIIQLIGMFILLAVGFAMVAELLTKVNDMEVL